MLLTSLIGSQNVYLPNFHCQLCTRGLVEAARSSSRPTNQPHSTCSACRDKRLSTATVKHSQDTDTHPVTPSNEEDDPLRTPSKAFYLSLYSSTWLTAVCRHPLSRHLWPGHGHFHVIVLPLPLSPAAGSQNAASTKAVKYCFNPSSRSVKYSVVTATAAVAKCQLTTNCTLDYFQKVFHLSKLPAQ